MSILFSLVRPVLHAIDAEKAHQITLRALKLGLMPRPAQTPAPELEQELFGLRFFGPVGMAAGFDKNADVLDGLFACGFDFIEAGTVTPRAQDGNPKPRIFRHKPSRSVINRMGFPGPGSDVFLRNYLAFRQDGKNKRGIVGVNIGKNKDTENAIDDYTALIKIFAPLSDYLAVNVSSPNTPGLRDLQKRENLLPLLQAMKSVRDATSARRTPLLVKLSPDLNEQDRAKIAQTVLEAGIDGLILANTTLERPETLPARFRTKSGGLSGPYVRDRSTASIADFYRLTAGQLPIIGVGGISSAQDAYAKIRAGASLIQLYTALVYQGPGLVTQIHKDLVGLLKADGFGHISQAIGADLK